MTYRERKEAKALRLLEWAEKRKARAATLLKANEPYQGDVAFNTQPGHIPERARAIARSDRAFESTNKALAMTAKAAEITRQLDRSIYSDDANAIEALENRIRENEAKREHMKKVNALFRKGDAAGLAALGQDYAQLQTLIAKAYSWEKQPYPAWELSNLGGRIKADKDRIQTVRAQAARTAKADAADGGVLIEGAEYISVTFNEKPDRAVLNALKTAGFYWQSGSWHGRRDKLPNEVKP